MGRLFGWVLGIWIAILGVLVALPALQSLALNTNGNATLLGFNLAPAIERITYWSSQIGKALGNSLIEGAYYRSIGPLARDPYTHSAWPYWGAPLLAWLLVGLIALAVLIFLAVLFAVLGIRFGAQGPSAHTAGAAGGTGATGGSSGQAMSYILFAMVLLISFLPVFRDWRTGDSMNDATLHLITRCGGADYEVMDFDQSKQCLGAWMSARMYKENREATSAVHQRLGMSCMNMGIKSPGQDQADFDAKHELVLEMAADGVAGCPFRLVQEAKRLGIQPTKVKVADQQAQIAWAVWRALGALVIGFIVVIVASFGSHSSLWPLSGGKQRLWAIASVLAALWLLNIF